MYRLNTTHTIAFIDTETTGLDPQLDEIWEFAAILRTPTGDHEIVFHIDHNQDRAHTLPPRFADDYRARFDPDKAYSRYAAAILIAHTLNNAILVGANPAFDADRLHRLLANNGITPTWHYRTICVETLLAGAWLQAHPDLPLALPWKSDDLSAAAGINPADYGRHTALGDCRWVRDQFDLIVGPQYRSVAE